MGLAVPYPCFAVENKYKYVNKNLSFFNTHTEEYLDTVFWSNGNYLAESLEDINHILRDHRTDKIIAIDTKLLELLFAIKTILKQENPFYVISGYRSPETNAYYRKIGKGVAKKSLHVFGKAIDIRLPGTDLPVLHRTAVMLKGGGVGYYTRSEFVHVDVGRPRYW